MKLKKNAKCTFCGAWFAPGVRCKICGKAWEQEMLKCSFCKRMYCPGEKRHLSGDKNKECYVCGKEWPSHMCKKETPVPQAIQKIKLPYPFPSKDGVHTCFIEGWGDKPGELLVRTENNVIVRYIKEYAKTLLSEIGLMPQNIPGCSDTGKVNLPFRFKEGNRECQIDGWVPDQLGCLRYFDGVQARIIPAKEVKEFLSRLGLKKNQIPQPVRKMDSDLTEVVSKKEWEQFQRWKDKSKGLLENSEEALSGWKDHLRFLRDSYTDFDGEIDDLFHTLQDIPRLIRYIMTGRYPAKKVADHMFEEDFIHEEDRWEDGWREQTFVNTYPRRGREIVEVTIQDISDGKL